MSLLMYRYRIYPSGKQKVKIINSLKTCKVIYNELLIFPKRPTKNLEKLLESLTSTNTLLVNILTFIPKVSRMYLTECIRHSPTSSVELKISPVRKKDFLATNPESTA